MPHRFKGDFSCLENKERKRILPAQQILQEMKIQRGDTLIDFGCGIGYFSIPALDFVGDEGMVVAVDVSSKMLQELEKRAGHPKNLEIIQADSLIGLTANIILLSMVLHEVDNPKEFLRTCFNTLKPNGRIFVIDWQKKETGLMSPPIEERLSKEQVIHLTKMKYHDHLVHEWLYFLEFAKD